MVNGTSRIRANVCASSVLPQPVGPISRIFDLRFQHRGLAAMGKALVVIVDGDRKHLFGARLTDHIFIEKIADLTWGRHPSADLLSEALCSSLMISIQSSTHSSQMNTVGPAISFFTSCWLLPQKEQNRVFLLSPFSVLSAMANSSPHHIRQVCKPSSNEN